MTFMGPDEMMGSRRGFLKNIANYVTGGMVAAGSSIIGESIIGENHAEAGHPYQGGHFNFRPAPGFHNPNFGHYPFHQHYHGHPSPQFIHMHNSMSLIFLGLALSEDHKRNVTYNKRTGVIIPNGCIFQGKAWAEVYDRFNNEKIVYNDNEDINFRLNARALKGHTEGLVLINPSGEYYFTYSNTIKRTNWTHTWSYLSYNKENLRKLARDQGEGNYSATFFVDDTPIAMKGFVLRKSWR